MQFRHRQVRPAQQHVHLAAEHLHPLVAGPVHHHRQFRRRPLHHDRRPPGAHLEEHSVGQFRDRIQDRAAALIDHDLAHHRAGDLEESLEAQVGAPGQQQRVTGAVHEERPRPGIDRHLVALLQFHRPGHFDQDLLFFALVHQRQSAFDLQQHHIGGQQRQFIRAAGRQAQD